MSCPSYSVGPYLPVHPVPRLEGLKRTSTVTSPLCCCCAAAGGMGGAQDQVSHIPCQTPDKHACARNSARQPTETCSDLVCEFVIDFVVRFATCLCFHRKTASAMAALCQAAGVVLFGLARTPLLAMLACVHV
jgi:hypothetical protein